MAATSAKFVGRTIRYKPRPEVHQFYRQYTDYYEKLLKQVEPALANLTGVPECEH